MTTTTTKKRARKWMKSRYSGFLLLTVRVDGSRGVLLALNICNRRADEFEPCLELLKRANG